MKKTKAQKDQQKKSQFKKRFWFTFTFLIGSITIISSFLIPLSLKWIWAPLNIEEDLEINIKDDLNGSRFISEINSDNLPEFVNAFFNNKQYSIDDLNLKLAGVNYITGWVYVQASVKPNVKVAKKYQDAVKLFKLEFKNSQVKLFDPNVTTFLIKPENNTKEFTSEFQTREDLESFLNNADNISLSELQDKLNLTFFDKNNVPLNLYTGAVVTLSNPVKFTIASYVMDYKITWQIPAANDVFYGNLYSFSLNGKLNLWLKKINSISSLYSDVDDIDFKKLQSKEIFKNLEEVQNFSTSIETLDQFYNVPDDLVVKGQDFKLGYYVNKTAQTFDNVESFLDNSNLISSGYLTRMTYDDKHKVVISKPNLDTFTKASSETQRKYLQSFKQNKAPVKVTIANTVDRTVEVFYTDFSFNKSPLVNGRYLFFNMSPPGDKFVYYTKDVNTWRIPGVVKTHDNKLIFNADKRVNNKDDRGHLEQDIRVSEDGGKTWSNPQTIVRISAKNTKDGANKGQVIDGTMLEVFDKSINKHKLLYVFGVSSYLHTVHDEWTIRGDGNTSGLVNNNKWMLFIDKENLNQKFVAKPITVDGDSNWFKVFKVKNSSRVQWKDIDDTTQLDEANIIIDNSLKNGTITGNVYDKVPSNIFSTFGEPGRNSRSSEISEYISKYSIWDQRWPNYFVFNRMQKNAYFANSRYYFDNILWTFQVESIDGGKTWTNLRNVSPFLNRKDQRWYINGVGNGIQLNHQRNSNGDVIAVFPFYFANKRKLERSKLMATKDGGKTWYELADYPFKLLPPGASESSISEDSKGNLWWLARRSDGRVFTLIKSEDGGKNWKVIFNAKRGIFTGQFIGSTIFNIKALGEKLIFSASDNRGGKIYLVDINNPRTLEPIYTINRGSYGYSTTVTFNENDNYFDVLTFYEVNSPQKGRDINLKRLRVFVVS
uniref:exo-alpha-sialidase n=1 Tax=Mycoplasmoides gallisepticum TaxID=2096 RepID=C0LT16_MYCGL|nr:sialidase [Mycoplasmoides gallisepticum]